MHTKFNTTEVILKCVKLYHLLSIQHLEMQAGESCVLVALHLSVHSCVCTSLHFGVSVGDLDCTNVITG